MIKILSVLFWAAIPIAEQRVAIPLGINGYKLDPSIVFLASLIGSILPAPFILLLFNKIFDFMKKYKYFARINDFIERKINKNTAKLEKYKELGLITFIAIPLPTTGVWTGCVVAAFLKLDLKKSLICAAIGAIISDFILTMTCVFFSTLF